MIKGRRASSKEHYEICRSWRGKVYEITANDLSGINNIEPGY